MSSDVAMQATHTAQQLGAMPHHCSVPVNYCIVVNCKSAKKASDLEYYGVSYTLFTLPHVCEFASLPLLILYVHAYTYRSHRLKYSWFGKASHSHRTNFRRSKNSILSWGRMPPEPLVVSVLHEVVHGFQKRSVPMLYPDIICDLPTPLQCVVWDFCL